MSIFWHTIPKISWSTTGIIGVLWRGSSLQAFSSTAFSVANHQEEKGGAAMLDTELARRLKQAGLAWQPAERDCFAIPDRHLDGQVFVVNRLTTLIQQYSGQLTITFHGSSEWALDDVVLAEVIWLPSETQLR